MSNDPVQVIKDEEAKTSQKIEDLKTKNHKDLDEHRITKEGDLNNHKENLRKKGQESLEKAKQGAMSEFKKITEDEDRNRNSAISQAETRKEEAVKMIASAFEKHLTK